MIVWSPFYPGILQEFLYFSISLLYIVYFGKFAYFLLILSPKSLVQLIASQSGQFRPRYGRLKCLVPWEKISYTLDPDDMG